MINLDQSKNFSVLLTLLKETLKKSIMKKLPIEWKENNTIYSFTHPWFLLENNTSLFTFAAGNDQMKQVNK
jgi:hypothetical protein